MLRRFLRLCLLTMIFFLDGLDLIIFNKEEVVGFRVQAVNKEEEEMISFINSLNEEYYNEGDEQTRM